MTEYDHGIDRLIINELKENKQGLTCTQLHDSFSEGHARKMRRTVRYAKVWEHLTKLDKAGLVEIIEPNIVRRNNERLYCLTAAAELELDFFGSVKPVRSGRESRLERYDKDEDDRKACLLTLLRATSGTYLPRIVNKPVLGAVAIYNQATGKYEFLIGEKAEGVLHQDIVAHNDLMSLFRDVDFTRSKDYVGILKTKFGLGDAIVEIVGRGNKGEIVKGIKIADSHVWLKEFLVQCECMLSWVEFRVRQTLVIRLMNMYKDGSLTAQQSSIPLDSFRIHERKACKWYIDTFGRKAFSRLYDNCRKLLANKMSLSKSDIDSSNNELGTGSRDKRKREPKPKDIRKFVQEEQTERESWIKQSDKTIIAFYHGLYESDRLVPDPPWGSGEDGQRMYNAYRQYVRNDMLEEFRDLMKCLSEILYPEFLRKHHGNNSELKQFLQSLSLPRK